MRWLKRLRGPLFVVACICAHALLRRYVTTHQALATPAARHDRLRVVSWNLRNFPGDEHDLTRIRAQLLELQPHVLALQEVLDPSALPPLLPGWSWHASRSGGRHGQHLVIGWDPALVELVEPLDHEALTMEDTVRPGLSAYIRGREDQGFHLVVVHLKATRTGLSLRREQWPLLVEAVATRRAAGPVGEDDVLVVGDFNVAGGETTSNEQELRDLVRTLQSAELSLWESVGGCTAYWDGSRRDGWWEPSRLDLVWSRGFTALAADQRRAWPGTHCARHQCDPLHATDHHPDPDLHHISDHCPIVIDLPWISRAPI